MLDRLLILQERGRPLINQGRAAGSAIIADPVLKNEIDALYRYYFGRGISGCKNCYADALIELINISKQKAMAKSELFVLRRGVVLKDTVTNDARKNLARGNETDELALYHLHTNPKSEQWFEKLPDEKTLKKMLANFEKEYEASKTTAPDTGATVAETAAKIIADAKTEAEKIITEADERAKAEAEVYSAELDKLVTEAEETAAKTVADAKAEAEKIITDAKAEAEKIITDAKAKAAPATKDAKTGKADPVLE